MFRPDPQIFGNAAVQLGDDPLPPRRQGLPAQGPEDHLPRRGGRHRGGLRARGRHRRLPDARGHRSRQAADGAAGLLLRARRRRRGFRIEAALQWTESHEETIRSYVNAIPTTQGGTHEQGFRAAIVKAVRSFIETSDLGPKGVTLTAEDIREGVVGVLSIYMQEPQFQGQTKERLGSPEAQNQVDSAVRPALETFLLENRTAGAAIVERIALAAKAREASRAAAQAVSRKTAVSHRLNLPGKLADCSSTDPATQRAVHRRGRLGRRLGQAGARAQDAGDPPAARQGAEHRAGVAAEGAVEQGAAGRRLGARLRRRRGLQDRAPALPQDRPADGRRLRRPPHRDAAADVLLPAPAAADQGRLRLPGAAAAVPRRPRQGDASGRSTSPIAIASSPACPRTPSPRSCASRAWARCSPRSCARTTLDPATRRLLRVTVDNVEETDRILTELMGKDVEARFKFIMERAAQADLDL